MLSPSILQLRLRLRLLRSRDPDASIRKRALELASALVNGDNVRPLVREMIAYLVS